MKDIKGKEKKKPAKSTPAKGYKNGISDDMILQVQKQVEARLEKELVKAKAPKYSDEDNAIIKARINRKGQSKPVDEVENKQSEYEAFLQGKVIISEDFGFDLPEDKLSAILKPHQKDICLWGLKGGRRAIFASFGLGKTFMQLEIAKQCIDKENKPFLICCPLAVAGEFKRDNKKLNTGYEITYITDSDTIQDYRPQIYITNYERVRMGDIDPSKFCGVSFDEASILRNLKTETTNYILKRFTQVPYRFVATATPTPNDYIEILNYAVYLGVASRGHLLTRFFQRDSTKAGHLTLYPNKEKEFWMWVSTWAVFVNMPSDLGYDNTGYDLPELNIIEHQCRADKKESYIDKFGKTVMFKDLSKSLIEVSREKRENVFVRLNELEKCLYICMESLNKKNANKGAISGVVEQKQGGELGEATNKKQTRLSEKQICIQGQEQKVEGGESGENERASIEKQRHSEVEGISEGVLSKEQSEGKNKLPCTKVEKGIRHNDSGIREVISYSEKEMCDLQKSCTGGEELNDRPLSQKEKCEGATLPTVQHSDWVISGQSENTSSRNYIPNQIIIWCDRNIEQDLIEGILKKNNISFVSLRGGETEAVKEAKMSFWRDGKACVFLSKTVMYGCGINMQQASEMIYFGITYKFQDFIQGLHRIFRYGQEWACNAHIIYTDNEYEVLKALYKKWDNHKRLQLNMIELVKEYGLNKQIIKQQMERQLFKGGKKITIGNAVLYNNDTVILSADKNEIPDNSIDMILTSIPFGDHYEYSDNYNDFGHNHGNVNFFKQMEFLTPNLLRCLKPGHVAAIHVKDRIRYSYQNGTSFTTISDFSGQTVQHFIDNGFYLMGKITVVTDVVRENNQTYRLGWSEQCKDSTKMGVGLPEYILLFRKAPTEMNNAYADEPVHKDKEDYTRATWQLDAHAFQRSSGNRFMSLEEMKRFDLSRICSAWKFHNEENIYSYQEHLQTCEYLEEFGKLSSLFMTLPVHSNNGLVWTDINRMDTLNTNQANSKKEKHICPLQLDIIERLINRYSMKGDTIYDPFGGLFSTAYKAIEMDRKAISVELNAEYFQDGCFYVNAKNYQLNVPTLFDVI